MKLNEVGFDESVVANLLQKPLLRDNIKSIEADYVKIYKEIFNVDMDFEVDDLVKIKSDLFAAFCHGVQSATRLDSNFRMNFRMPKEFDSKKQIITPNSNLVTNPSKIIV